MRKNTYKGQALRERKGKRTGKERGRTIMHGRWQNEVMIMEGKEEWSEV